MMARQGSNEQFKKRSFTDLRPSVQSTVSECLSKLGLVPTDLDVSVYDSLLDFPAPVQDEIISSFCKADLAAVRNKTGYFIGILKQYRKCGKVVVPSAMPPFLPVLYSSPPQYAGFIQPSPFSVYGTAAMSQVVPVGPPLTGFAALPLSIQYKFHAVFASGDVTEAELPESIYETLREFDESTQAIILDHFSTTRFAKIRSKAGYFISLLKLARAQTQALERGFPQVYGDVAVWDAHAATSASSASSGGNGFFKLSSGARARLARLYEMGVMLEDCVYDSLCNFPPQDQVKICEEFGRANLRHVRNKTAFFIGILKRHRSQPATLREQKENASSNNNHNQHHHHNQLQNNNNHNKDNICA